AIAIDLNVLRGVDTVPDRVRDRQGYGRDRSASGGGALALTISAPDRTCARTQAGKQRRPEDEHDDGPVRAQLGEEQTNRAERRDREHWRQRHDAQPPRLVDVSHPALPDPDRGHLRD